MKRTIAILLLAQASLFTTAAQAQRDWNAGDIIGGLVGGAIGFVGGKEICGALFDRSARDTRNFASGVCAGGGAIAAGYLGSSILGDLMSNGNDEDVNEFMRCHNNAYTGPVGYRECHGIRGYRGSIYPLREYRHRDGRGRCRMIRYEMYDRHDRPMYSSRVRRDGRMMDMPYRDRFECRGRDGHWGPARYDRNIYIEVRVGASYDNGGYDRYDRGYNNGGYQQAPAGFHPQLPPPPRSQGGGYYGQR